MGIIIDVILVLFLLGSTYLGYKKGLVKVAVSLVAFIAAIIITVLLYRPIGDLIIKNTDWDENLQKAIQTNVDSATSTNKTEEEKNITDSMIEGAKNEILPGTSKTVATNIMYGGTMIGIFIVSRLLLLLINLMADAITSLPIIKQFNEAGGIAYGILRGIIIVYAIVMLLNLIISFDPQGALNDIIQNTFLTKLLMNFNIFNLFMKK
ncbi:MAG: CvpA family protein [Clostridia bacterium]|nr:CvpA family protein [Clostridia bacterium]